MSSNEVKIATVSQINLYIKKIIDGNTILKNVWIKGEISNFKKHHSGHMYLTLKDEGGVLTAVMFKSSAYNLAFKPEDGMKVVARGRISVYERDGKYQLYIEEMLPDGLGDLYAAFEELKKKLLDAGLFDEQSKKPLPKFPKRIGIVTATTGAAVRDMINITSRRFPLADIVIYPSLVQGENASKNIIKGIEYFNAEASVDVIIIGRGGGSIEDLWAFNDEKLAYVIYNSNIAIISAVGHETDFTIADFVADLRASTPSAAAELVVPSGDDVVELLKGYNNKMIFCISRIFENRQLKLKNLKPKSPKDRILEKNIYVDMLTKELINKTKLSHMLHSKQLANACAKIDALSPLAVMGRGYAVISDEDKRIIKSVKELAKNKKFKLTLSDGEKDCIVL